MRIVLGVGAGIAAYKACELLRLFTEAGHSVRVVPTPDSLNFVGAATWAALSGQPAVTTVFEDVHQVPHVRIGQDADLVIVAPATADLLARAAAGMSGDLLTATLLTARCPVIYAPAMHTEMWEHPATQANVARLRSYGALVIEPASGRLTGADSGPGRLPEPAELFAAALRVADRGPARAGARPGRPQRPGVGGRDPRGPRSRPVPRQPLVGPAGLRAGRHRGQPRRPGDPGRRQHRAARPGGRAGHPGRLRPRPARQDPGRGGRRRRHRDGRRRGRLPARAAQRGQD